jgi:predicted phosphodiesterase
MKLQLLSDLHLETENFVPEVAPEAELLVLAGDIDSTWAGYERFAGWPVPVLVVPGNHEADGRDIDDAQRGLRTLCDRLGFVWLEKQCWLHTDAQGRRTRFVGTTRWSDFDTFGADQRERAQRAATYFLRLMASTRGGQPLDAAGVRALGIADRAWLQSALEQRPQGRWDKTVVVTHFAPSLRSADPRYGHQPGSASFCNADDDLLQRADLWLHGHLHCRHDYRVARPGRLATRVVCNARGLEKKGEHLGIEADAAAGARPQPSQQRAHDPLCVVVL